MLASPRGFEGAKTAEKQQEFPESAASGDRPGHPDTRDKPAEPRARGTIADDSPELGGVVETALAEALTVAVREQRWELVARLADELKARREARSPAPADLVRFDPAPERAGKP
jgi:hypothetical protein